MQKHITISYHAHLQYAVIVNSKFWNGLPADIRKQLDKAMDEATDYTNSIARQGKRRRAGRDQDVRQDHAARPDRTTSSKAWQTAMPPTYKWAKGRVGQEVLDLLAKELDIKMN